jgi:hypothetical protein
VEIRRDARLALAVVLLLVAGVGTTACTKGDVPAPQSEQAAFDAAVSKANTAWQAGDAEAAFNLYTEALKAPGAKDSNGVVAGQQETAKRLMLSRRILANAEPSLEALSSYAQVLQYSSVESTEAAAARNGLADSLKAYPKEMRAEVAAMRKAIKGDRSVEMGLTASLVSGLADGWRAEVAQAPGAAGVHAAAAAKYMGAAAAAVEKAFDRKYAEDALRDLTAADKSLAAAVRELTAARTGK